MKDRPLLSALTGDAEIAAQFAPDAELRAMLDVEAALARAQGRLGLIMPAAASHIEAACREIVLDREAIAEGLARDGVSAPEFVRQLRRGAGAEFGASVHEGATSQDIIDTGLMLRLTTVLDILATRFASVLASLDALEARDGAVPLMAQTRMQAALPFTAAAKLRTWRGPLERERDRLGRLLEEGLMVQLGGPVGDGSSFGDAAAALRADVAAQLGLRDAAPWHSARAPIAEIGGAFALIAGVLGKIGQDVALLAQNEIGAVKLAGGGESSAMAHKQNPVGAEVLVALARYNAGLLGTLHQSMVHENERSGAAWTLEWMVLPQMAEAAGAALCHGQRLLGGLEFRAGTHSR